MAVLQIFSLCVTLTTIASAVDIPAGQIKLAAQRSVALIQKVNSQWKTPCLSCHHQILGAFALQSARHHGIGVDETLARRDNLRDYKILHDLDGAIRVEMLIDPAIFEGSMLMGAHAVGIRPSLVTAAYVRHVAGNQLPDGHWPLFDARPPQSHSEITSTAIAAQAVKLYHPQPEPYLARAMRWLLAARPPDTEGATFRLLGLLWTGASPKEIEAAAAHLAGLQRGDGAWVQTPLSKEPDAYSTAEALYALRAAGAWQPENGKFQLGVKWLLDHQAPDGSWHVKSRIDTKVPVSPPYFESGFPYGHDQFLSMAATSWAVRALAEALPEVPNPPAPLPLPVFDETQLSWARTAMLGTLDEVARINPNAATAGGTTALMIAASDPAKVELLLKRGAKAKAVTKTGYDALMIAALFYGNSRSVELLLKAGAPVAPARKVRFNASALAHAVIANDPAMVQLLLANGANPNYGMRLLGGGDQTPLVLAASYQNVAIIRHLARGGARIDEPDANGMTALSAAALSHRAESVKALLELNANPRHKDKFGLIPLEHTLAIADSPGDTAAALRSR